MIYNFSRLFDLEDLASGYSRLVDQLLPKAEAAPRCLDLCKQMNEQLGCFWLQLQHYKETYEPHLRCMVAWDLIEVLDEMADLEKLLRYWERKL